jgi:hypothetical protein
MFYQVQFAEWSGMIAVVAFVASAAVFTFFLVGALRSPRTKIDHDASLPFEKERIL